MDRALSPIRFWQHAEMVCRVATSLVGAFLFAAAMSKSLYPDDTEAALGYLAGFIGASPSLVSPAFIALLLIETLLGSALVFDIWPRASVTAVVALLLGFSAWALFLMVTRVDVPCGCGVRTPWGGGTLGPAEVLTRNGLMIAALFGSRLVLMCSPERSRQDRKRADPVLSPSLTCGPLQKEPLS